MVASKRTQDSDRLSSPNALVEDDHHAVLIPWQSSDLPLSAVDMCPEYTDSADSREDAVNSAASGSLFTSSCSTPSENNVEQIEWCQDYIKVAWSDDDTE